MKLNIANFAFVLFIWLFSPRCIAQAPTPPAVSLAEMKKLNFLVGNWRGEGWVEFTKGQRHAFRSTERVEMKLDGLFLLIEGIHHTRIPGRDDELKIHHAVATVTFDQHENALRVIAHKLDGKSIEARAAFKAGAFVWGFKDPRLGHLRYTIRLNDARQWFEIGERSADGASWDKFFEMTLSREEETAVP